MQNRIKETVTGLIVQAQRALPGVVLNEGPLGLALIKADSFALKIANLVDSAQSLNEAKAVLSQKRKAYADQNKICRKFAMVAREVINAYIGKVHSPLHVTAGFVDSLAVPRNTGLLLILLEALKVYLTNNPAQENEPLDVTAAHAATSIIDLTNAMAAVDQQNTVVRNLMAAREVCAKAVRKDLITLSAELRVKLDPMAREYDDFGLNRPGAKSVPEVPENVTAVLVGTNDAAVKWGKSARATTYRIFMKVVGVDADWVYVESRTDLDFTIRGLPAGATIEIAVSASNSGGESAKSAIATVRSAGGPPAS